MSRSDKKRYAQVALILAGILLAAVFITMVTGIARRDDTRFRIVTSFYPVYTAALQVADGVDNTVVVNLTPAQTGCLHDYQLTPDNMITLTGADALILNGAGAESFLDDVRARYPDLPVVDTSADIALIEGNHHHEHGEEVNHEEAEEHEDGVTYNEHIWTSPSRYMQQVENLRDALIQIDPAHAEQYRANAASYIAKIKSLRNELLAAVTALPTKDCITFHDSMTYFAEELGLTPIATLSMGEESGVSAADLAQATTAAAAVDKVLLLYDNQYDVEYTTVGAGVSYSRILKMDTAVTGNNGADAKNAWLDAMRHNLDQLKEAAR